MSFECPLTSCKASFNNAPDSRFHILTGHWNPKTIWICPEDLQAASIGRCNEGYGRACALRAHLKEAHGIPIHNDETVSSLAVGPDYLRFWCGFCRAAIPVSKAGQIAWATARTEHIQAHFLCWNGVCANNDLWFEVICRDEQVDLSRVRHRQ